MRFQLTCPAYRGFSLNSKSLTIDRALGLDRGEFAGYPEHGSIFRLLEREQSLDVLREGPLHGRIPRLRHPPRHGGYRVPVLLNVRDYLLVPAELVAHVPVLYRRLLHIRYRRHAHLRNG